MNTDDCPGFDAFSSRRRFVQSVGGFSATVFSSLATGARSAYSSSWGNAAAGQSLIRPGDTILFQGDSITDGGRIRDDAEFNSQPALGNGYAWLAAAEFLLDRPDDLRVFNRGVSGNKVNQLSERWVADCLNLNPNVLSILIGVNDAWQELTGAGGDTLAKYETEYRDLLNRTKTALPDVRIIVCEPFVLRCGTVTDKWFLEFARYRASARKVADEVDATFVPFQSMFDRASKVAPPERWAHDSVHPTADGATLMAYEWLKAVGAWDAIAT